MVTLMNSNDPMYAWNHAMDHRTLLGAMPAYDRIPTNVFSAVPYWIHPQRNDGMWHLNHNQAHLDAITTPPPTFGQPYPGLYLDPIQNDGQQRWFTWANEREHLTAHSMYDLTQPMFPTW